MRPARFLIVSLLFTIYYLLLSPVLGESKLDLFTITPVSAQASQISTNPITQVNPYLQPNINPDVPQNLGTFTQSVMINLMSSMMCQLTGIDPVTTDQQCLGVDPQTGKIGFVENGGGAIGVMGSLIAMTFTPPASATEYLSYMGSKFGIVAPAYAQGTGFDGIRPIVSIWAAFRNFAYLAFIVAFVLIGLAIMLRVHIDPRTVMTIQNSIPKIIIALILVTLSFAIAGFLIDLMYVTIYFVFNLLNDPNIVTTSTSTMFTSTQQQLSNRQVFQVTDSLLDLKDVITRTSGAVKETVGQILSPTAGIVGLGGNLPNVIANTALNILGGFVSLLVGFVALLIITIAILWALFRLWFSLLMAYVWILLDIVFAPLWVLGGVIPGSPVGFGAWLRDISAHLSAFPTTLFMLMLGRIFMDSFSTATTGTAFVPPLIGAVNTSAIGALVGLGVILLTPQVVNMVKDAVKAPKFPYGAAIGQAIGVGMTTPFGTAQTVGRFYTGARYNPLTGAPTPVDIGRGFRRVFGL